MLATVTNLLCLYLRRQKGFLFAHPEKDWNTMNAEHVMENIRREFERSGMTLTELGQGLGYDGATARKRAWYFLYRTSDPRISTVLAVANALGVKIGDFAK